jgi:replicative DNA helicase
MAEHGLDILIVDYIQLMQGARTLREPHARAGEYLSLAEMLAKELNVPVVILSQLSRAPESRSDHRPMLSDLRESGALEQDADVVMLLFRPDQYPDVKPEDENIAEINVAKQRNGPTGLIRLAFMKSETRFGNLEQRR